jgi:hypothetical protein
MCIENVVVCMIGSVSVFHCGVSEPPTARNPATLGFSTRSSTRNGTAGSRPSRRSASSPAMMAASAFGPSSRSPSSLSRAATVRLMIGVLTISPSHSTSRSHSHQASSGSAASAAPLGRRSSSSRTSSTSAPSSSAALSAALSRISALPWG